MSITTVSSDSSSGNSCLPEWGVGRPAPPPSRYESQKRRDWNTFGQYLKNHRPPLALARCSGAHVLEFLRYLDQFGKTKVHTAGCPFFGHPHPPAPCPCPLRQAWGSLDALIGRLRAAFEENGGQPEANPFGARAVRLYLREVRDTQGKARGIAYEKKKRKKSQQQKHPPQQQQNQQQHLQSIQVPSPPRYQIAGSMGPNSHMVDLNLMNGVYPNTHPHHNHDQNQNHHLLFHGHFLTAGDGGFPISIPSIPPAPVTTNNTGGGGGVAGGGANRSTGGLFCPERLLLCEM